MIRQGRRLVAARRNPSSRRTAGIQADGLCDQSEEDQLQDAIGRRSSYRPTLDCRVTQVRPIASWRPGVEIPLRLLRQSPARDPKLRARIQRIVLTVPLPLPQFRLAAFVSFGEPMDIGAAVPDYYGNHAV